MDNSLSLSQQLNVEQVKRTLKNVPREELEQFALSTYKEAMELQNAFRNYIANTQFKDFVDFDSKRF